MNKQKLEELKLKIEKFKLKAQISVEFFKNIDNITFSKNKSNKRKVCIESEKIYELFQKLKEIRK